MDNIKKLETEIQGLKERNIRVGLDKAWEQSNFRVFSICLLTYIVAVVFLLIIKNENPFVNALVPALGFYLSTQSLPMIKKWWVRNYGNKK